jgi:MOSC domain-containing protein YiiM
MRLVSVNVSEPREIEYRGQVVRTGIFKKPVSGRVGVRRLNIDGDGQADLKVHGGYDMAVYAYPIEHYPHWEKALGRDAFPHGQFGENLTVEGLLEETVRVGDVFRIGTSRLQVTQPRIPCYKLAIRMDQGMDFPKRFQDSGRPGFYFRVLEEGAIGAGDAIELLERDTQSATIAEFIEVYLRRSNNPESLRRMLAARELGDAWRDWFEKMLQKAEPVPTASGWAGFRTFVVDRKVPESDTITSFYLRPKDDQPLPPHRSGQFLTFRLDIPGQPKPVTRTYTISDAPHAEYYRISIKREPPRWRTCHGRMSDAWRRSTPMYPGGRGGPRLRRARPCEPRGTTGLAAPCGVRFLPVRAAAVHEVAVSRASRLGCSRVTYPLRVFWSRDCP